MEEPRKLSAVSRHLYRKMRELYLEDPAYRRHIPKASIRKVVSKLERHGYIEALNGYYQLTLKGRLYLRHDNNRRIILRLLTLNYKPTRQIYREYLQACLKAEIPPVSHRRILGILDELAREGAVVKAKFSAGRYGVHILWRLRKP